MVGMFLAGVASAALFSAEDLVTAHARGLPAQTSAAMAESVDGGRETAVYLLRRGVPTEVVRGWGYPVTEAEGMEAERLGALAAPAVEHASPEVEAALGRRLDFAVWDQAYSSELSPDGARRRHVRTGRTGIAIGALLGATGIVGTAVGMIGHTPVEHDWYGTPGASGASAQPNVVSLGIGAVGLLGAGVSFEIGAHHLRLAGNYPNGWEPPQVASR